jgi:NADPH oxidase 5
VSQDLRKPRVISTDTLWFHIKASGNWTRELREHFQRHANENLKIRASQNIAPTRPSSVADDVTQNGDLSMQPIVPTLQHIPNLDVCALLDGPYGASTTALFNTEHAVLIGAGIGVTPFASVLGSVLAQFRQMKMMDCPSCHHNFHPIRQGNQEISINNRPLKLKKLDFIWVSREQENIQWFVDLLEGWEKQQQSLPSNALFMDCQIYITSIPDVSITFFLQSKTSPITGRRQKKNQKKKKKIQIPIPIPIPILIPIPTPNTNTKIKNRKKTAEKKALM